MERHCELCVAFLHKSRNLCPYPEPDYEGLTGLLERPVRSLHRIRLKPYKAVTSPRAR